MEWTRMCYNNTYIRIAFDVTKLDVKTAAATALGAGVQRAKVLASKEERDVQRYVAFAIDQQLKKLEAKMQYVEQLEDVLNKEREQVELARQELAAAKAKVREQNTL